jgi:protochlorophyllide reductase
MPATSLARGYPAPARRAYAALAPAIARVPGATTPAASASQLARMVTDPAFAGPGGCYIELDRPGTPSATARDTRLASELWAVSEELTTP